MGTTRIYILCDPQTHEVRYVGKTTMLLCNRLAGHMRADPETHSGRWIKQLISRGLRPKIHQIDEVFGDWADRERYWIKFFRDAGAMLTNVSPGGDGHNGFYTSPETIRKITEKTRGQKRSPEFSAKISARMRGVPKSDETKKKISAALTGRKLSPAHIAKVNAGRKSRKGCVISEDQRKKISAANKGKVRSLEFKAKLSAAHKGRIMTPEHRRNLSVAARKHWARKRGIA